MSEGFAIADAGTAEGVIGRGLTWLVRYNPMMWALMLSGDTPQTQSKAKPRVRTATCSGSKCDKNDNDPCSKYPTRKVAQNQALAEFGISPTTKPIARRGIQGWEQYLYKNPNNESERFVLSHHPNDNQHPCPHWHIGTVKMLNDDVIDTFSHGAWRYHKDGPTVQHRFR